MSLNFYSQSAEKQARIDASSYRKSDYAKALDSKAHSRVAPQDRVGTDYEQLRAVASAGERGLAGPQRRAEADQDLENVVGDSLRRSAYQQDEDQRAMAEAGNQLRFNAMSDDERLRFDILGDQKTWGDADPDDFSFRMSVLEMMQNQRREDKDRQAYEQQQAVLAERAEAQYQFDMGQQERFLEQQRLDDEARAYRTSDDYNWMTDRSLSGEERLGMAMSESQLRDYYASEGMDQFGIPFADRTPGAFDKADFSNVDFSNQDAPHGVKETFRSINNFFSAARDKTLGEDADSGELAKEIEAFDGGLLLDNADLIINNEINEGGDEDDVRRALRSLVAQYQGDEKPPSQTVEMLMAYASMGQ